MAKCEGDRVDTDCFEWSRNFLTKLLSDHTILAGEGNLFIKTKKVDKVKGDACIHVRNGKIIPGYKISLTLSFEGEAKDSDGQTVLRADGIVEITYIADDKVDEDPEVRVFVNDDGPVRKKLEDTFLVEGKQFVVEQVRAYHNAMAIGGPVKDELEVKKVNRAAAAVAVGVKKEEKEEELKIMTVNEMLRIYENRSKGFRQSYSRISTEVGGDVIHSTVDPYVISGWAKEDVPSQSESKEDFNKRTVLEAEGTMNHRDSIYPLKPIGIERRAKPLQIWIDN